MAKDETKKLLPNELPIIPMKEKVIATPTDTGMGALVGDIGSRPASTVSDAINSEGNLVTDVINSKLDTSAENILGDFTFGESGALTMQTDADNGLWISANGILAKKAGENTLTVTTAGDVTMIGTITAGAGAIGGWNINSTSIYTGTEDHDGYTTNAGDITIYSNGTNSSIHAKNFYIDASGNLTATSATISGNITITSGSGIANFSDAGALATKDTVDWNVDLSNIPATLGTPSSDGLYLSSDYLGYYKSGAWTSFIKNDGDFYFAGDDDSSIDWNVTTPSTLTIKGKLQANSGSVIDGTYLTNGTVSSDKTKIAIQGWTHNLVFSATNNTTVAWTSGSINLSDGSTTYSIDAGNTGVMSAITYIYLDIDTSETALQTTTTYSTAIGDNKILIAVAENVAADKKATFQVYGGRGGIGTLLTTDNLAANCVTANLVGSNEIITNSANIANAIIGDAKITDLSVSKLTAGSITSKAITLAVADGTGDSKIQAGKTDFTNDDSGFILGIDDSDSDKAKFYIGDNTSYLNWDGSQLTYTGKARQSLKLSTMFENISSRFQTNVSANATLSPTFYGLECSTSANANEYAELYIRGVGISPTTFLFDNSLFSSLISLKATDTVEAGNDGIFYIIVGWDTSEHYGFKAVKEDGIVTLYATSADATPTVEQTSLGTLSVNQVKALSAVIYSDDHVDFYVNNSLVATHSTYIPASDTSSTTIAKIFIKNYATTYNYGFYVANFNYELLNGFSIF